MLLVSFAAIVTIAVIVVIAVNAVMIVAFNDKYRELEGNVYLKDSLLGMNINKDNVYADFTMAIEDNKVFIKSNNPYIKYNDIKGLTLPYSSKRKATLVIGPSFTYGYDFNNKEFGPTIGISATYGLDILRIFK